MLDDATDSKIEEGYTIVVYVLSEVGGIAMLSVDGEVGQSVVELVVVSTSVEVEGICDDGTEI